MSMWASAWLGSGPALPGRSDAENAHPPLLRKLASGLPLLKVLGDPLLMLAQMSWSCAVSAFITAKFLTHAGYRGKVHQLPAQGYG